MKVFGALSVLPLLLLPIVYSQSLDQLIDEVFHKSEGEQPSSSPDPPPSSDSPPSSAPPPPVLPQEPEPPRGDVGAEESECECVPYYQCGDNGTIINNGVGLIDIRFGFSPSRSKEPCPCTENLKGFKDGPCADYLDVCCKKPQEVNITPKPPIRRGCGERHPEGVGFRITGDEDNEAQFGEFPWMVAVLRDERDKKNVYQCGGALIHPQVVLTAAHCVMGKKPSQLKIRAGEWDTQTKNELFPHQDRQISKIIVHKNYYAGALYNDVSLMFLETPVELADNVDVICLPTQGATFDHTRCVASGWGKDVFGKEGRYQVILKKVELPIVPHDKCQESLRKTRLGQHFNLHESFICAGGEHGIDTCKGDGGSPLVCPFEDDKTRYQQVGIVAWGIGCGEDIPGVYANIPMFRNWIDEQLSKNNFDATAYHY